jgi:IS5 family transposase
VLDLAFLRFGILLRESGSPALGKAMTKPRDDRQKVLLLPALDQLIDMGHPPLAALIDWNVLDDRSRCLAPAFAGAD